MFVRLEEGTRRAIAEAATARAEARREAEEAEKVKVFQCENIPEKVEVFQCQLSLSRLEAPKLLLSMLLCSGLRNTERWLLQFFHNFHNFPFLQVGEEAALRVEELASSLQEYKRKEAQWKEETEKKEGKTDVIGAIMAAIGEMPDSLRGQLESQTSDQVESDVERMRGESGVERMGMGVGGMGEQRTKIEIMDEDIVCIEENFDSNLMVENGPISSEENFSGSKQNDDELMEEVTNKEDELMGKVTNNEELLTNNEELSFTAALEELGGLLDFSPL